MKTTKLYLDPRTGCVTPFNPKEKSRGEIGKDKG